MNRRARIALLTLSLIVTGSEFIYRGPWRAVGDSKDFAAPFLASRAWLAGRDPFDPRELVDLWRTAARGWAPPAWENLPPVYPPTALPVIAPLAALSWATAHVVFLCVSAVALALSIVAVSSMFGIAWGTSRALAALAATLAWAPVQTGLSKGNPGILVGALAMLSIWTSRRGWDLAAGAMLGIGLAIKPQVAAAALLYFVLTGRHRTWIAAVVLCAAFGIAAVPPFEAQGLRSWVSWTSSLTASAVTGGINDPTATNPYRYQLINLTPVLTDLLPTPAAAVVLAFAFVACGVAVLAFAEWRPSRPRATPERHAVLFCALCVLSLLPVYHRAYDAVLVLPALLWTIATVGRLTGARAALLLICFALFLWPGASALTVAADRGWIPDHVRSTMFWRAGLVPHQTWALCLLAILLVEAHWRSTRSGDSIRTASAA